MANFTVRIELLDAERENYTALYEAMAIRGFTDLIQNSDGTWWHLPDAEYNYQGNVTLQTVLDKAIAAATLSGADHRVLVTESAGRMWYGLRRA